MRERDSGFARIVSGFGIRDSAKRMWDHQPSVIPGEAGIDRQESCLDPRLREDDGMKEWPT
jgi:hypothetical protein